MLVPAVGIVKSWTAMGDELEVTESPQPNGSICTQMVTQVMPPGPGGEPHIEFD